MDKGSGVRPTMTWLGRGRSNADDVQGLVRWLRQARAHGGLSGGLLFDGEEWLLLMRGPQHEVQALLDQLAQPEVGGGPIQVQPVCHDVAVAGWRVGYVDPGQLAVVWDDAAPSVDERCGRLLALLDGSDAA